MLGAGLRVLIIFNAQQPVANLWTLMLDAARDRFLLRLVVAGRSLARSLSLPHAGSTHGRCSRGLGESMRQSLFGEILVCGLGFGAKLARGIAS